jgi:hypothetical protein
MSRVNHIVVAKEFVRAPELGHGDAVRERDSSEGIPLAQVVNTPCFLAGGCGGRFGEEGV